METSTKRSFFFLKLTFIIIPINEYLLLFSKGYLLKFNTLFQFDI